MSASMKRSGSRRRRVAVAGLVALLSTGMLAFVVNGISKCQHSACVGLYVVVLPVVTLLAIVATASGWPMTSPDRGLRWAARILGGLALLAESLAFLLFGLPGT